MFQARPLIECCLARACGAVFSVSTFLGPAVPGSRVTCYYVSGGLRGGKGRKRESAREKKKRRARGEKKERERNGAVAPPRPQQQPPEPTKSGARCAPRAQCHQCLSRLPKLLKDSRKRSRYVLLLEYVPR